MAPPSIQPSLCYRCCVRDVAKGSVTQLRCNASLSLTAAVVVVSVLFAGTGDLLCEVLNKLRPGLVPKYARTAKHAYAAAEPTAHAPPPPHTILSFLSLLLHRYAKTVDMQGLHPSKAHAKMRENIGQYVDGCAELGTQCQHGPLCLCILRALPCHPLLTLLLCVLCASALCWQACRSVSSS